MSVLIVLCAGSVVIFWQRKESKIPPTIDTSGLDATATALIRQSREAVLATPRSSDAWGRFGRMLKSFNFRPEARISLAQAERLDPTEPRWPYYQAMLLLTEQPEAAAQKLSRTVALSGNEPAMPRLRLGRLLIETGQQEKALAELQQLIAARPECAPASMLIAQITYSRGEMDRTLALAKPATTNPHTARVAWTLLSNLALRKGDTNAAEMASRRASAVTADVPWPDPYEDEITALRNDRRSLSERAQNLLLAGRAADALPLASRLRQEYPEFAETWLVLGRAQYLQGQPQAAEESLRRFLKSDSNSVVGHFQLGMSLLAQHHYPDAIASFERATALKPDFGPAFLNIGFALVKSGKLREAVAPFKQAIQHNPEVIDSYILLADLRLQLGENEGAAEMARLAERVNPNDRRLPALRQKLASSN
jgi:tetratricopeptide (TPR) repeat protein